jgi:hypothetical protein
VASGKPRKEKPSDYFRLRRFEIHDGQIVFEDRRERSNRPPLIWKNMTVEMDTEPTSGSLYSYDLSARNPPLAGIHARGKIDVDSARLDVERFVFDRSDRDKPQQQLPPSWQSRCSSRGDGVFLPRQRNGAATTRAKPYSAQDPPLAARGWGGHRGDRLAAQDATSSEDKETAAGGQRPVVADRAVAATQPTTRHPPRSPPAQATADHDPSRPADIGARYAAARRG